MRWKLNGIRFKITDAMRQHARRRILKPLSRLGRHIRGVNLSIRRVDRSQASHEVQALVMLNDGQVLAVNQESPCYYSALDGLADRMKEAVRRRVERYETARRKRRRFRKSA